MVGRLDSARATLAAYDEAVEPGLRAPGDAPQRHLALGVIALAEGRAQDALAEFQEVAEEPAWGLCGPCAYSYLGWAHEEAGQPDSAIGSYERFLTEPHGLRVYWDARYRVRVHERLGVLYEARGELEKARYHYGRVAELWQDADPALRPRVEAARRVFGAVSGER